MLDIFWLQKQLEQLMEAEPDKSFQLSIVPLPKEALPYKWEAGIYVLSISGDIDDKMSMSWTPLFLGKGVNIDMSITELVRAISKGKRFNAPAWR